jgi:polyhydroxybutyrate depolymerase
MPLVMMLHGAGADIHWTLEETSWDRTAERGGFLLVLPEATPLDPTRPGSFLANPTWWNDASPTARSAGRKVDDVAFLSSLIAGLREELVVGPGHVCVTGFSNGAAMTFRLAAEGEVLLGAIAPVAGHCWVEVQRLARPRPTLYLVGKADPIVPLEGGLIAAPWGWKEQRPAVSETLERWRRSLDGQAVLEVQLIEGLGHHWPGGRGLLSRRLFGPSCPQVQGNELIWEFFRRELQ